MPTVIEIEIEVRVVIEVAIDEVINVAIDAVKEVECRHLDRTLLE